MSAGCLACGAAPCGLATRGARGAGRTSVHSEIVISGQLVVHRPLGLVRSDSSCGGNRQAPGNLAAKAASCSAADCTQMSAAITLVRSHIHSSEPHWATVVCRVSGKPCFSESAMDGAFTYDNVMGGGVEGAGHSRLHAIDGLGGGVHQEGAALLRLRHCHLRLHVEVLLGGQCVPEHPTASVNSCILRSSSLSRPGSWQVYVFVPGIMYRFGEI